MDHLCKKTVSKTLQNENDDQKDHSRAFLYNAHKVQLTSHRAILSFSNFLARTVENASKQSCEREFIDAFSMKTKTHTFLVWTGPNSLRSRRLGVVGVRKNGPGVREGDTIRPGYVHMSFS